MLLTILFCCCCCFILPVHLVCRGSGGEDHPLSLLTNYIDFINETNVLYINRLFAYCKGDNLNMHIWSWLGSFIY